MGHRRHCSPCPLYDAQERVKVMEDKYNQVSMQNAQASGASKPPELITLAKPVALEPTSSNPTLVEQEEKAKAEKDNTIQQSTLQALDDLQQSLHQIEAQSTSSSAAQRALGLNTAAAMLNALRLPPKEAASGGCFQELWLSLAASKEPQQPLSVPYTPLSCLLFTSSSHTCHCSACPTGLSTAAKVVTQLSESPETAGEKPGTEVAVAALAAHGCAPADPKLRQGLAAAAATLRTMSKSTQANTQPQGLAAAALFLNQKGINATDAAHAPGMAAAAHVLHTVAADVRTPPSQVAGITQGANTL
eukprot:scaffold103379_cov17-Tisochrysis_lutea.AAC.1